MPRRMSRRDLADRPERIARALLGARLVRVTPEGERLSGLIVETEAYLGMRDKAAHSYKRRRTERNESMYAKAGTAYVYFTYGMHHCMNVVCGEPDEPVAVLLRALQPEEGLDTMRRHRLASAKAPRTLRDTLLCSGPARLCQALDIDRALDGEDMATSRRIWLEPPVPGAGLGRVRRSARIGIGSAQDWVDKPLRWFLAGNPHVSR